LPSAQPAEILKNIHNKTASHFGLLILEWGSIIIPTLVPALQVAVTIANVI